MKKFDNLQKKDNIFSKGEGADVLKNAPKRAKDVVAVCARYVREGPGDQKTKITEARTFIAKITDPSLVEKRLSELELELKKNPASGKQARLDIKTGEAPGFKAD